MNSKAMQVKVQREKESCNGTMKENRNTTPSLSSKDSRLGVAMDHRGVDFEAVVLDR